MISEALGTDSLEIISSGEILRITPKNEEYAYLFFVETPKQCINFSGNIALNFFLIFSSMASLIIDNTLPVI